MFSDGQLRLSTTKRGVLSTPRTWISRARLDRISACSPRQDLSRLFTTRDRLDCQRSATSRLRCQPLSYLLRSSGQASSRFFSLLQFENLLAPLLQPEPALEACDSPSWNSFTPVVRSNPLYLLYRRSSISTLHFDLTPFFEAQTQHHVTSVWFDCFSHSHLMVKHGDQGQQLFRCPGGP